MPTSINHIALPYADRKQASLFFTEILGIPRTRSFTVSPELTQQIFGVNTSVDVDVFDNGTTRFEIFISTELQTDVYAHTCIEVEDKQRFITMCKQHRLHPYLVPKGEKELLFVRDFSHNLYEVKEK